MVAVKKKRKISSQNIFRKNCNTRYLFFFFFDFDYILKQTCLGSYIRISKPTFWPGASWFFKIMPGSIHPNQVWFCGHKVCVCVCVSLACLQCRKIINARKWQPSGKQSDHFNNQERLKSFTHQEREIVLLENLKQTLKNDRCWKFYKPLPWFTKTIC